MGAWRQWWSGSTECMLQRSESQEKETKLVLAEGEDENRALGLHHHVACSGAHSVRYTSVRSLNKNILLFKYLCISVQRLPFVNEQSFFFFLLQNKTVSYLFRWKVSLTAIKNHPCDTAIMKKCASRGEL